MAIIRWEPVRTVSPLQSDVGRLFSTLFDTSTVDPAERRWVPPVDFVEDGSHFVLHADLPGLDEGDVMIEFDDRVLTISGERRLERTEGGRHRLERPAGPFRRALTLPEGVDAEAITATFARGVLEVRIPKPEQQKPRRVLIGKGAAEVPPVVEATSSAA